MVGDEVIGIYFLVLTARNIARRAVGAGTNAHARHGHADPAGPGSRSASVCILARRLWVSIGVEGGNYQFAALGDTMNFGARLVGAAKGGELIMSATVWNDVSGEISAEPRRLELKGYAEPVTAYVARIQ